MTLSGSIINCYSGLLVINKYMKAHVLSMIFHGVCFHLDTPCEEFLVLLLPEPVHLSPGSIVSDLYS